MAHQDINWLLAETTRLRKRFERTQPNSARLPILMRDEQRLRRLVSGGAR